METGLREGLAEAGIVHVPQAISAETLARLQRVFEKTPHGIRNLLDVPEVRELAGGKEIANLLAQVCDGAAFAMRAILFDKHVEANWKVPYHQDLTIAVRERKEAQGFGPWTVKCGVQHVQPPASILKQMFSIRLHLDDSTLQNGPLHVFPGSHRNGRLSEEQIEELRATSAPVACTAAASSALIMRPLLVHGSPSCQQPSRRRVIHIEFAQTELPYSLQWHDRVLTSAGAHHA